MPTTPINSLPAGSPRSRENVSWDKPENVSWDKKVFAGRRTEGKVIGKPEFVDSVATLHLRVTIDERARDYMVTITHATKDPQVWSTT